MSPKYTGFSGDHKGVVVGCSLQACFGLAVLMHTPCALTGIQDKQSPSVRGGLWFVDVTSASGLHLQQSYGGWPFGGEEYVRMFEERYQRVWRKWGFEERAQVQAFSG